MILGRGSGVGSRLSGGLVRAGMPDISRMQPSSLIVCVCVCVYEHTRSSSTRSTAQPALQSLVVAVVVLVTCVGCTSYSPLSCCCPGGFVFGTCCYDPVSRSAFSQRAPSFHRCIDVCACVGPCASAVIVGGGLKRVIWLMYVVG